jgi:hypothetical protein
MLYEVTQIVCFFYGNCCALGRTACAVTNTYRLLFSVEHTASNVNPEDGGDVCLRISVNLSGFLLLHSQRIFSIFTAVRNLLA